LVDENLVFFRKKAKIGLFLENALSQKISTFRISPPSRQHGRRVGLHRETIKFFPRNRFESRNHGHFFKTPFFDDFALENG
jgi:hypothetical protein